MIKLRHYQAEVRPNTMKYLQENEGKNPLIVLPTGSGKTFAIADLVSALIGKVLVLSHVKEIIEQNHSALEYYLDKKVSVYSAMVGKKEIGRITVGGIQSIYRCAELFEDFDYIIIDECHLVSHDENTMYRKFIAKLNATVIGFTATPFRLGMGYIYGKTKETIFDDVVVDWGSPEKYNQLVEEGYLCKLTTKRTVAEMDTSGIKMIGGDFSESQLADRFDRAAVTKDILKEVIAAGKHRNKWMIFAIDIDHAEHIAEMLIRNGIKTAVVHSKMSDQGFCRFKTVQAVKDGDFRCVVNVNILTTGFDDPSVDLIACMRPTSSPVLHVQSLGRGSRIHSGKEDCLVLDFAGNTERLGPINNPLVRVSKKGEGGDPITKVCPKCASILAPAVRFCPDCGHEFKFEHGLSRSATNNDIIEDGKPHWIEVDNVSYEMNVNFGRPSNVKVTYHCGNKDVHEYICVEHKGFAKHKADHWVKYRGGKKCNTAADLVEQSEDLNMPTRILVQKKGKYKVVMDSDFNLPF